MLVVYVSLLKGPSIKRAPLGDDSIRFQFDDHYARKAKIIDAGNLHIECEFNDVSMICEV
jgi:hypothetical protein